jgi:predicted dehydrogenase
VFLQSYRAELAHFVAVVNEDTPYDPPDDQLTVIKLMEAIYKAADEGKEVRL